ncbi:DUF2252 domain-containing protein [Lacticaseibacillus absianus]|uniref:DUF2252 domain-containing protein n=1 Tax=Lacticaseibacillus absianus TaxID=2729623 RepID=UPI0015CEC97F|nr:DUF2252 domain-containing protein [Lacticaseibacillus absianus]
MQDNMLDELFALRHTIAVGSQRELHDLGQQLRARVPIDSLRLRPVRQRDPVAFIQAIEANLIQTLLPARHAKMLASPAAFFRGTAELMAYDLSHGAQSGIRVLGDGDAHLQNFGFYASPERNLLFDLNDFDEAAPNAFEFDVKRLVTSVYLLGAQDRFDEAALDDLARHVVRTYRKTVKHAFKQGALTRFYASSAVSALAAALPDEIDLEFLTRIRERAAARDSESVVKKYTATVAGQLRFKPAPPRTVTVSGDTRAALLAGFSAYQDTVRADVGLLLSQYHVTDVVRHSVGIGSFGTSCYLILLTGMGGSHLVLQVKEALPRRRELAPNDQTVDQQREVSEGQRIIAAQQILQKASDPFLGWFNAAGKSFYVRQFRDMKESIDPAALDWPQYEAYCHVCAYLLALAHAQSPSAAVAAGYMDKHFDLAVQRWCKDYLQQVIDDYAAFVAAVG